MIFLSLSLSLLLAALPVSSAESRLWQLLNESVERGRINNLKRKKKDKKQTTNAARDYIKLTDAVV